MLSRINIACALVCIACNHDPNDGAVKPDTEADTSPGDTHETTPEVSNPWLIEPGLFRLAGVEETLPYDDLENLWPIIGDADYIGLGESAHTSGGFYAIKERLIRWLVEVHGVRVFGMETPRTPAKRLDAYIQSGACDVEPTALFAFPAPIYPVFIDDNTAALFRWLCEWNATHDDRVRFFGFDVQPSEDLAEIGAFLAQHDPLGAEAALATLARCHVDVDPDDTYTAEDFEACTRALDTLQADLTARSQDAVDMRVWAELMMTFTSLRAWQKDALYYYTRPRLGAEARDIAMADLFEARVDLDFPGERVILWAHNYHLTADHENVAQSGSYPHTKTLGSELRARHGHAYRPVAITARLPGINWPGFTADYPTNVGDHTIEQAFYDHTDAPAILYDLASEWAPGDALWTLSGEEMIMRNNFEAIIFLRESPPMNAILW